jgi:hypothetical protein
MKRLAPQKKNKRNIQQQHHHDQWIYEETPEMSDLLVIKTPQIKIVGVDLDAGEEIGEYDEYSGRHSKDLKISLQGD